MNHLGTCILAGVAGALLLASAASVAQSSPPASPPASPPVIGQKDRRFSEEQVTLRPGGRLRFVNDDAIAHNVYARDPAGANQAGTLQKPGEETDLAFAMAGQHQVLCAIHPRMRMTVNVQP